MTYEEAKATILKGTKFRVCLGLERMRQFDFLAGQPGKNLKFIHVAGTNGKGSTSTMISQILVAAGYKVGLFTSPSLQTFNERFWVNGKLILDSELQEVAEELKPAQGKLKEPLTEFELITGLALRYFANKGCDYVVLEVGLGGRLDATNIIKCPKLAVITSIGLDHTELLGFTVEEIAREKAGIVKPGTTVILSQQQAEICEVVKEICRERQAELLVVGTEGICLEKETFRGQALMVEGLGKVWLPLVGAHQRKNLALAVAAAEALKKQGAKISNKAMCSGLKNAFIPARFELLSENPVVILDGGHNPQCFEELACALKAHLGKGIAFVLGVLQDKDYKLMLKNILPLASLCYCVTPPSERALDAKDLCEYIKLQGGKSEACSSVEEALNAAMLSSSKICCAGSLYFAGKVREYFGLGPGQQVKWQDLKA